jgi:archaeosine-15-forming tRNA-guanine transglycosylase
MAKNYLTHFPNIVLVITKGEQQFIEVTKSVFEKYITFLKTESNQYFISAQREIM